MRRALLAEAAMLLSLRAAAGSLLLHAAAVPTRQRLATRELNTQPTGHRSADNLTAMSREQESRRPMLIFADGHDDVHKASC